MNNNKVINFFIKHSQYQVTDIITIKPIHSGYTNDNFLITTSDKKYQVRMPLKIVDHTHEIIALKTYKKHNVLFINKDGFMIKEWIEGRHPSLQDNADLALIIDELKILHNLAVPKGILKNDWMAYFSYNSLSPSRTDYFLKLVERLKNFTPAFNHHDLNALNILISPNNEECILIDFEWCRINSRYFDYASLALTPEVDVDFLVEYADLDFATLKIYEEIILLYSHMWCNFMNTKKSKKLQLLINHKLDKRL